jgi:hypothetical protein
MARAGPRSCSGSPLSRFQPRGRVPESRARPDSSARAIRPQALDASVAHVHVLEAQHVEAARCTGR